VLRTPTSAGQRLLHCRYGFNKTFWIQQYSCGYGFNKTFWLQQYSSPAGGKKTQMMAKIICTIATLLLTITLNLTMGSGNPFVRTFRSIIVWCMHNLRSWGVDSKKIWWGQGRPWWPRNLVDFSDFRNSQVWVQISACRSQESLFRPREGFWLPEWRFWKWSFDKIWQILVTRNFGVWTGFMQSRFCHQLWAFRFQESLFTPRWCFWTPGWRPQKLIFNKFWQILVLIWLLRILNAFYEFWMFFICC